MHFNYRQWLIILFYLASSTKVRKVYPFVLSSCFLRKKPSFVHSNNLPTTVVWIEEAEDGFVDEDENLEKGEVCLKVLKAFANPGGRFLSAGALVKRPSSSVCDAWIADALPEDDSQAIVGPNLVFKGARQILDALFLFHLQQNNNSDDETSIIGALQTFVLQCGASIESECTCASFMAGQSRGFRPLKDQIRSDSIYVPSLYENNLEGFVFDVTDGKDLYYGNNSSLRNDSSKSNDNSAVANDISLLLPNEETIQRFTTKRYRYSNGD